MRYNIFHGLIGELADWTEFPSLQIIDLTQNIFSGSLPSGYFEHWPAMKVYETYPSSYIGLLIEAKGDRFQDGSVLDLELKTNPVCPIPYFGIYHVFSVRFEGLFENLFCFCSFFRFHFFPVANKKTYNSNKIL